MSDTTQLTIGCDVHTHTLYSRHAYSTIAECVSEAAATGLELLGSTDHLGNMIHPSVTGGIASEDIRDYQHFINFEVWPRVWQDVKVLHGAEIDICDLDGHLYGWNVSEDQSITRVAFGREATLKEICLRACDYAIASIHKDDFTHGATIAQTTDMYLHALEDPKVLIIGHPGRVNVPFDVPTVLAACKEKGKLIEVNEHSFHGGNAQRSHENCRKLIEACAEAGVMISTGTDAHISPAVGKFGHVRNILSEVHFPQELVATTSADTFLAALERGVGTTIDFQEQLYY